MNYKTAVVIPCYNEEKRLSTLYTAYSSFLKSQSQVKLCFVDDGSTDGTLEVLHKLKGDHSESVEIIVCHQNGGKAEAVRQGVAYCNAKLNIDYIAFLDADLSTSLPECLSLVEHLDSHEELEFVFGSRIAKIGSIIQRRKFRFIVGRVVATMISNILGLKVYDTQCGCKVFKKKATSYLFNDEFISKWLFDVEIFFRMMVEHGKEASILKMDEVPLKSWIDQGDSKVKLGYFFYMWMDLLKIKRRYSKLL